MLSKSKSGFVMIETIVVAVFVIGIFTFLFANILPLIGDYEKTANYDTVDSKYSAHLIRKMILKDEECRIFNLLTLPNSKSFFEFENTEICQYLKNKNYCNKLLSKDYLDVKKIIITKYTTTDIKNDLLYFDRQLEEYIKYTPNYDNNIVSSQYFYKRRLIVIFNDNTITNIELLEEPILSCSGGC